MSAHTPGPWHRNIKAGGKYPTVYAGRNTHVAQAVGHGTLPPEEIEANISLIAAAPTLRATLEALYAAVGKMGHIAENVRELTNADWRRVGKVMKEARAVLKKLDD